MVTADTHQLRRLIVRLLTDVFNPEANEIPDTFDSPPLMKYSPDRSEGVTRDEGMSRRFGGKAEWVVLGGE